MNEQLSSANLKTPDLLAANNQHSDKILSDSRTEDIHLFLPLDVINTISKSLTLFHDHDHKSSIELPITKQTVIKQIRTDLSTLTNSPGLDEFNTEIAGIIQQVFDRTTTTNTTLQNAIQSIIDKQQQLKNSYAEKLKDNENAITSIFSQPFVDSSNSENVSNENQTESNSVKQIRLHQFRAEQLSFFAVQSLISMLLMLLKSVEKYDSTIVHQMLILTNQLIEQIPLNYLSSDVYKRSSNLFKSLKPLANYISELSMQTEIDPIASNQSIKILLNFSIVKGSFKDVLSLIGKLIFNTTDIYDIRKLFIELNKDLTTMINQFQKDKKILSDTTITTPQNVADTDGTSKEQDKPEAELSTEKISDIERNCLASLEYLKSIEAFPSTQLIASNEKKFTGQFISSILLVHIDLYNQLHAESQFERGSMYGSFSFELESETFKYLYEIIEHLTMMQSSSNNNLDYIVTVCLRLFTTHLKFLITSNNENFHDFMNENDIEKWFILISKFTFDDKSEERKKEASKALIYLIDKKTLSFPKTLTFFYTHIMENKHPILVQQIFDKLAQNIFIYKWIETLCDDHNVQDKTLAYTVLHSFIDIVLKPNSIDVEKVNQLRKIIFMFQELLFVHLNNQPIDISNELQLSALSTLGMEYTTHVIQYCIQQRVQSILLQPLLYDLCALTESKFNFANIQPIFTAILPIFAEYLTQTTIDVDDKNIYLISWLLGKMSHRLIIGPQESPLEKKYNTTLKLPLFAGGYETFTIDSNPYLSNLFKSNLTVYSQFVVPYRRQQSVLDSEFLLSIYNNTDQGAQLISKMKLFIRDKQQILQKSIESNANDACAAVFAVYIKHYRRIDLAQHELTQPIDQKPHAKLLSLYEYANQVRMIFATTKAQGGDCNELYKKIKNDTLLLLVSVKESSFISTIKEDFSIPIIINNQFNLKRQKSHWTKAKYIIRLLRNVLNACIRLKYLMLAKKQTIEQKKDSESVMHRAITSCLFGNDISTSVMKNDLKIQSDEVVKCLIRQYQRAMTRWITYVFIYRFIEQVIIIKDNNRILNILIMNLMNLKSNNLDWHYLENIQASNNQLKEDIGHRYYSIVKKILSFSNESTFEPNMKTVFMFCLFNLLNLSYDSMDLCHFNHFQFISELFNSFVRFAQIDSTITISKDMKLTAFNWFRLFVLKLCDNIEIEELRSTHFGSRKFHHILQQQRDLIFSKLILTELKQLQENKAISTSEKENGNPSLKNASIGYFMTSSSSSTFDVDACINQYLMLLLRCIHLYDHIRSNCSTMECIQQLLSLYYQSQLLNTRILILKILRDLLVFLPDNTNATTCRCFVENLLTDILLSIGQNFNLLEINKIDLDIVIEFIYIYRTIMSQNSPWQKMATKLIIDAIKSSTNFNFTSLESIENRQMNIFLASLCILGGYIEPYCLGSTVEIYDIDKNIHESKSATILEIDTNTRESDSSDVKPYLVQYAATNHIQSVSSNQLRIITDVQPPNLSLLPIDNVVHIILDTLGFLAQIDTSKSDSLILLQIKRRAIIAFYSLLNNKSIVDIFMQKSYASLIAKLSISIDNIDSTHRKKPNDLRLFDRLHLEQYNLSLDKCARTKQIVEDEPAVVRNINGWNQIKINRDLLILQNLSATSSIDEEWRPIIFKNEIQTYKRGKIGNDEIHIIARPANENLPPLEECGDKHKFKGRVNITDDNGNIRYPTFIVDGIELNEGKWYFCVKFLLGGQAQVGWATNGFTPVPDSSQGIGNDQYSWGYDGSQGICHHNQQSSFRDEIRWNADDICGCGIEIDGENTTIKYWLNGQFLGTAFSHSENTTIESTIKTNLLPHGLSTTYYPGVSIQVYNNVANTGAVEFIFSPEDMIQCPLPKGYKPLLIPTLMTMENVLVAYPYSAYLIGNEIEHYFYTSRYLKNDDFTDKKISLIRDFVNDHHCEVPFNIDMITHDHHLLKLSEDSDGFPLSIDNSQSLTISFDFEIITTEEMENRSDELDIILFALENEMISIRICMNDINDDFIDETMKYRQRVAILFQTNEQTKVYINNKYQTLNYCHRFDLTKTSKLNLQLLPYQNVGIRNLAVWKYTLSEEHIRRLFTYGLLYVAVDYQKLNEYRKQANTFVFMAEQKYFTNDILVPFNESFQENLWERRKQYVDHDESIYFKTISGTNRSVVQLFGNKTYLVLNTSNQVWSEYTLILDISIPSFPSTNDQSVALNNETRLTLLTLDTQSEIYLTHDGHICLSGGHQSSSIVKLQEYIRLLISVQQKSVHIYVNGSLELNASIKDDQFATKLKRIDLFREIDLTKNTTGNDQLRIECRSITFWNKSTDIVRPSLAKLIQSTEYSLDQVVAPPFWILSTSLIGIGYKEESIKYVMKQYNTTTIHFIDTILREQSQEIEKIHQDEQQQKKINVLARLNSYDKNGTLAMLMKFDNNAKDLSITTLSNDMLPDGDDYDKVSENEWYRKTVCDVGIHEKLTEWMRDKTETSQLTMDDPRYKLLDLTKPDFEETTIDNELRKKMKKSLHYLHRQIPRKTYIHSRTSCEYGLITIYARYTILNMFKVWYNGDHHNLFPLNKFGDGNFIVTLLRLMDYHYTCTRTHVDETINRMKLLTMSILKIEIKELLKSMTDEQITDDILNRKAQLFYQLQKHVIEESIHFLAEPSLIVMNNYNDETIDEQMLIKQSNLDFLLNIVNLFLELLTDFEMKKYNIDLMIQLLFPTLFIKILFDLFLLVPSHRSKIFILHIFTTLIQKSENFKLHNNIQHFILQLFIELTTNKACLDNLALKNFRIAIMDLAFSLFGRQKELLVTLNECPSEARDVSIILDVINILTNKTKQFQWPESLLTQSSTILGEKLSLTKDMVAKADVHFNRNADEQLMKFMNQNINRDWNPLPHESLNQFIESLSTESVSDTTKYHSFSYLRDIPSIHIQTRAKLFYLFNIFIGKVLLIIDLSLPSGSSTLTDQIRAARNYILHTTKFQLFNDTLAQTASSAGSSQEDVRFDTVKASLAEHPEDTMFYQAYQQLYSIASQTFRRTNDERVWTAIFIGMHSSDGGGPFRDSITRMCGELCSTKLPLFILCPNGRMNSGSNRDRWIPNVFPPNQSIPDEFKNQYRFLGQLMGMAIRTRNFLDVQFPILLWKQLVQEKITIEDIEAIDISSFSIINQMEENIKQIKSLNESEDDDANIDRDYLFSSIMSELVFDIVSSAGQTYELIPGGFHIPITAANFEDYCIRYRQYRINEFYRQIDFIRQGLYSVIPSAYLTLFTASELEEAVCGKGYIDIEMLKRHTYYNSDSETTPHIVRFWSVLSEMFSEEQKKLFLIFVWGRSTLPNRDEDFSSNFSLNRLETSGNVDGALPKSHTCSFALDLPEYSTKEITYERLNYAITYCSSIDNDWNMN
ncbi:unnamed protein product [Rotaria sordida]|uniref:Uncharacterized protein n=1 Tax=Rotaria sordida TaxID=392033 RepID=A0A813SDY8_9BILA|nr:unnamed protein product [Rotaria sordida]